MKKTILALIAISLVEGLVNLGVNEAAPRPVKSYPTKVRLGLVVGSAAAFAYVSPYLENKILGDQEPARLFGMDILS